MLYDVENNIFKISEGSIMKNLLNQFISLGVGAAVYSKEQIEKSVEELVKKGEISKGESGELIERLIEKGSKLREEMDSIIASKVSQTLDQLNLVSKDELRKLERRIEELEQRE